MVRGQLATRKWTDKEGVERYTTEIVLQGFGSQLLLLSKSEKSAEQAPASKPAPAAELLDDEIPF